jgi:hypothetical protein
MKNASPEKEKETLGEILMNNQTRKASKPFLVRERDGEALLIFVIVLFIVILDAYIRIM